MTNTTNTTTATDLDNPNQYRKKPVVIEAIEYRGAGNFADPRLPKWMWAALKSGAAFNRRGELVIKTLEGEMTAQPGDWIIQGVKGEIYPCKPEIFAATYERAALARSAAPAPAAEHYTELMHDLMRFECVLTPEGRAEMYASSTGPYVWFDHVIGCLASPLTGAATAVEQSADRAAELTADQAWAIALGLFGTTVRDPRSEPHVELVGPADALEFANAIAASLRTTGDVAALRAALEAVVARPSTAVEIATGALTAPVSAGEANPWHDAVLAECMKIETAYKADDPDGTIRALINWYYEEASGVSEGVKRLADNYMRLTCRSGSAGEAGKVARLTRTGDCEACEGTGRSWVAEERAAESAAAPADRIDEALANFLAEHTRLNQDGIDSHSTRMALALNYAALNSVPEADIEEWREEGYIDSEVPTDLSDLLWKIEAQDDLATISDSEGRRIATGYGSAMKALLHAHNAAIDILATSPAAEGARKP